MRMCNFKSQGKEIKVYVRHLILSTSVPVSYKCVTGFFVHLTWFALIKT